MGFCKTLVNKNTADQPQAAARLFPFLIFWGLWR